MALLFLEGFDDSFWDDGDRWPTRVGPPAISTNYGRDGTKGIYIGDAPNDYVISKALTITGSTVIWGAALNVTSGTASEKLAIDLFGTGSIVRIGANPSTIEVVVNGNTVTTDVGSWSNGAWHYLEVKVVYSATVGTIDVQIDGANVGSATGLDTGTAPSTVAGRFGGATSDYVSDCYLDDVYCADGSGTYNNDFLGDVHIYTYFPNGNGNSSGLVGSDGNSVDNYLLVDEDPPDSADYVGSATEGDKDTYTFPDLPSTGGTVHAIEITEWAGKSDSGTKYMRHVIRTGSIDYVGTSKAIPLEYGPLVEIVEENPNTTAAWTPSEFNGAEFGVEVRDS